MIVEMRIYTIQPGQMDGYLKEIEQINPVLDEYLTPFDWLFHQRSGYVEPGGQHACLSGFCRSNRPAKGHGGGFAISGGGKACDAGDSKATELDSAAH
jgi:hypothetical protein